MLFLAGAAAPLPVWWLSAGKLLMSVLAGQRRAALGGECALAVRLIEMGSGQI